MSFFLTLLGCGGFGGPGGSVDNLLLESGDNLLLESGSSDTLVLE